MKWSTIQQKFEFWNRKFNRFTSAEQKERSNTHTLEKQTPETHIRPNE